MKRMHVHVAVDNLDTAIGFYATLFAAEPTEVKPDYAKWMLEDPRVNFAISRRGNKVGLNHLGIQVENEAELVEVYGRLKAADAPVRPGSRRGHAWGQNERLYHLGRCDGVGRLHRAARGEAVAAGEKLIAVEQELDRQFAEKEITPSRLASLTSQIGERQRELREIEAWWPGTARLD